MTATTLYLSSLESERFELVRECQLLRFISIGADKPGALARLTPGVFGHDFGASEDLTEFVLTTRMEGADIRSIHEFPCFVFIALPRISWDSSSDRADPSDLEIIAWGELYRTASDAEEHRFG